MFGETVSVFHRDIIAQGDSGVQAIFNPTPLPDLNLPAVPFHDNQTKRPLWLNGFKTVSSLGRQRSRSRIMPLVSHSAGCARDGAWSLLPQRDLRLRFVNVAEL